MTPPSPGRPLRPGLAAAAAALLGAPAPPAPAAEIDTALLFYSEIDRVTAFESATTMRKALGGSRFLNLGLVVDILTGASANGALPSDLPQTFTRPSGRGSYVVDPGDTPLDDTFQDNRVEGRAGLETGLGEVTTATFGGSFSIEYDYRHRGVEAALARDLFRRNTTLALGISRSWDSWDPEGGIPVPFAFMLPPRVSPTRRGATEVKNVIDVLAGWTQILSRSALAQLNYSYSRSTGYLNDPFKVISLIDGTGGPGAGRPVGHVYENRPAKRVKQSFYAKLKKHLGRDLVEVSYRYLWDDWGHRSHTADLRYRFRGGDRYLQPHLRLYRQSEVDFFTHFLVEGDPFPAFGTADYRQGSFTAATVGVKVGRSGPEGGGYGLRIEYYLQVGAEPPDKVGIQRRLELFPDVGALIAQFSYSFDWW